MRDQQSITIIYMNSKSVMLKTQKDSNQCYHCYPRYFNGYLLCLYVLVTCVISTHPDYFWIPLKGVLGIYHVICLFWYSFLKKWYCLCDRYSFHVYRKWLFAQTSCDWLILLLEPNPCLSISQIELIWTPAIWVSLVSNLFSHTWNNTHFQWFVWSLFLSNNVPIDRAHVWYLYYRLFLRRGGGGVLSSSLG